MRTSMFTCHIAAIACFTGCSVTKPAELKKFKDVKRAVLRDDGLYNVICTDGNVETSITLEQLENDEVCNDVPAEGARGQFVQECRKGSMSPASQTFTALKG